ncbi:MAG: Mur ligase family protein [Firmicutes bacterium]|nr:Mur ligase family protein [Bacillota bacterium]
MNIHFVGNKGVSMKRLSEICVVLGHSVSGSDTIHNKDSVVGKDLVVYTNAVGDNNEEVLEAKRLGIRTIERAEFLGEIANFYKKVIAVSGTHGKTTTTSMLAEILRKENACMHIGGNYPSLSTPPDKTDFFITEACEYKRSFLTLKPYLTVILNAELDHTDYFSDFKDYFSSYKQLAKQSQTVLVYGDDDILYDWAIENNYKTFGLKLRNTYIASNIKTTKTGIEFYVNITFENQLCREHTLDVPLYNSKHSGRPGVRPLQKHNSTVEPFNRRPRNLKIHINEFGAHSVINSLASVASAHILGIYPANIINGLKNFSGVARRQELLATKNNIDIYSDYAHHPSEITTLLQSMRERGYKKIIAVFEPHTYTRTASLKKEFATSLSLADELYIMPVFAAREIEIQGGKSETLVAELAYLAKTAYLMPDYKSLFAYLNKTTFTTPPLSPTALLFIGAGSIDSHAREFAN